MNDKSAPLQRSFAVHPSTVLQSLLGNKARLRPPQRATASHGRTRARIRAWHCGSVLEGDVNDLSYRILANVRDFHDGLIDSETFSERQRNLWTTVDAAGPEVRRAVLADIRETLPSPGTRLTPRPTPLHLAAFDAAAKGRWSSLDKSVQQAIRRLAEDGWIDLDEHVPNEARGVGLTADGRVLFARWRVAQDAERARILADREPSAPQRTTIFGTFERETSSFHEVTNEFIEWELRGPELSMVWRRKPDLVLRSWRGQVVDEDRPDSEIAFWAAQFSALTVDPTTIRQLARAVAATEVEDEHAVEEATRQLQYTLGRLLTGVESAFLAHEVETSRGLPEVTVEPINVGPWTVLVLRPGTVFEEDGRKRTHRGEPLVQFFVDEAGFLEAPHVRRVLVRQFTLQALRRTPVRHGLRFGFKHPSMSFEELDKIKVAVEEKL